MPEELRTEIFILAGMPVKQEICVQGSSSSTLECGLRTGTLSGRGRAQRPDLAQINIPLAIFLASHAFFAHAAEIMYSRNTFVFENPSSCNTFMRKIGGYDCKRINTKLSMGQYVARITLERFLSSSISALQCRLWSPSSNGALQEIHFKDVNTANSSVAFMGEVIRAMADFKRKLDRDNNRSSPEDFILGMITTTPSPHSTCKCQGCLKSNGNSVRFSRAHTKTTCPCEQCRPWREFDTRVMQVSQPLP